jgi:hypothetical protein
MPRLWNRLLDELQANTLVSAASPLLLSKDTGGLRLGIIKQESAPAETVLFGSIVADITGSANVVSVKKCDLNGVTSGDAFDVYLYSGQGYWDPTAVTVAGASATATCKLAAGKIIAWAYSGEDAYMLGDVAQIVYDVRYDTTSQKIQAKVYWRVGIAVSTVSEWIDVLTVTPAYGLTTEDFVTGDVVTVTPCTAEGEAIPDAGEVDVYLRWDGASVDLSKDADGNFIDAKLPEGTVVSYFVSDSGYANSIVEPSCVCTRVDYSSDGIRSYHRWLLAGTQTTEGTTPVARVTFYDVTAHQVQWDNTNKKLQYRTVTFTSPIPATEGAWTDLLEFECLSADTINSLTGSTGGGSYT